MNQIYFYKGGTMSSETKQQELSALIILIYLSLWLFFGHLLLRLFGKLDASMTMTIIAAFIYGMVAGISIMAIIWKMKK